MSKIDPTKAKILTEPQEPVPGFPMKFVWHEHYWPDLFDEQKKLIQTDIQRARAEDKIIVYLSCPISGRGGGFHRTNVEIAQATERRLRSKWGERFWILNPTAYQLESKEGLGLIAAFAREQGYELSELISEAPPSGGDYMRMWTQVLVTAPNAGKLDEENIGAYFDAYYFLGPSDVETFFQETGGRTLTASVEAYFASKFATDPDFREYFAVNGITWGISEAYKGKPAELTSNEKDLRTTWERLRQDFVRFYTVRASVAYSLGSHDEWNIFRLINENRRRLDPATFGSNAGIGAQLSGFFDGRQIDPSAAETPVSSGYAR